jgi:hypothetical protein
MGTPTTNIPERPAQIGDRGTVLSWRGMGFGSGLAELLIGIEEANGNRWVATIHGDHRPIRQIAEELQGHEVQVIEGEGSGYGCHSIQVI